MKEIIVREYLESLKEDKELDLLFPILLNVLGFQVVTTPKEYKGHKQYGKDIIALGIDPIDKVKKRFYFELKGGKDRHITIQSYAKNDGIRMSIIEAKDRDFSNFSINGFNSLPIKIVIVHNGTIMPNVIETLDGLVKKEFPRRGKFEFERWDISKLTQLFTKHLFSEYLLTNEENIRLFKRMLVFIDVPENSQRDFYVLVDKVLSKTKKSGKNTNYLPVHLIRLFESLKLIGVITHQYSLGVGNLESSKKCISYLLLKTWGWMLSNKLETNKRIVNKFNELSKLHKSILNEYFEKMLPIAQTKFGLFSESSGRFEQIGFPIRCMEFLKYLNYWFITLSDEELPLAKKNEIITTIITLNDGTYRPLLDNHSIPILLTIKFYLINGFIENAKAYISKIFEQIILNKNLSGILPDGKNNPESLIRLVIRREKSIYYEDSGSMLIGMLFELLGVLKMEDEYYTYAEHFQNLKLSTFIPFSDDLLGSYLPEFELSHEEALFSYELYQEGFQSEIKLESDFAKFIEKSKNKTEYNIKYRSEEVGYKDLKYLAHIFYDTPLFPNEWRALFYQN